MSLFNAFIRDFFAADPFMAHAFPARPAPPPQPLVPANPMQVMTTTTRTVQMPHGSHQVTQTSVTRHSKSMNNLMAAQAKSHSGPSTRVYQTKDDNSNNKKIVEKVPTDGDSSKEAKKMLAISDRTRSSSVSDNNWKRSLRKEKQGEMLLPAIRYAHQLTFFQLIFP